ncbi:MAG: imidazolonepropionase [Planctomycetota bacterium]|jgi:imidazolonepropionase|nr:imidazolonepropionase [Planctomycetota bacterium]
MARKPCDYLLCGIGELYTMDSGSPGFVAAPDLESLPVLANGAVAVLNGKVAFVGSETELKEQYEPAEVVNLKGALLVPGLVDAHTHPAFAEGRAEEFDWRARGLSYLEIAKRGGGILSSVRAVREASEEELTAQVVAHFQRMQAHGTVACEAKSGYGLTLEDEVKSLRAIKAGAEATGMEVLPTFLGAHMVPQEFKEKPDRYVEILCEEVLPAIFEQGLARAADVFIEDHAFTLERAERYLSRASDLGFALRVHSDQFANVGGTELAVSLGAESVDHLEVLSDAGLDALVTSGTTCAGLLPTVPHFLRQDADAPAHKLLKAGVPWFVATDFNPGSCYTASLPEAAHFARIRLNLTALEALAGMTLHAATSLGAGDRLGRIAPGYEARFTILDLPDLFHFGYGLGENPARIWSP